MFQSGTGDLRVREFEAAQACQTGQRSQAFIGNRRPVQVQLFEAASMLPGAERRDFQCRSIGAPAFAGASSPPGLRAARRITPVLASEIPLNWPFSKTATPPIERTHWATASSPWPATILSAPTGRPGRSERSRKLTSHRGTEARRRSTPARVTCV